MSSPVQQLLSHQVSVPRLQVWKVRFLPVMPTRQEVLEALRTVAEEVLASLKLLMTIVFTMTSAIDPNQEATDLQMNPVNQLIHEVAQQRRTIDQLGNLIQAQFLQKPPTGPGPIVSPVNHVPGSEDFEWEAEMVPHQSQAASTVPSSSQSMPAVMMNARAPNNQPPPMPVRQPIPQGPMTPSARPPAAMMGSPGSSYAASEIGSQLMVTQASLESWGNKIVGFGKKHLRSRYAHVYESDPGYIKWILARADNLSEDVADFASYARARNQLEQLANNPVP